MNKKTSILRSLCSLCMALCLLLSLCVVAYAEPAPKYTIGNPYETVDWDNWQPYKTQLHVQTNASDGGVPMNVTIEEHYRLGYDILAITDHMVLGSKWNEIPKTVPLARYVKKSRTLMAPMVALTDERREEIINGVGRGGRGMMEVSNAVELNGMSPRNSHLNAFFTDYGGGAAGVDGDYETMVERIEARGGITFLDHLGLYTKADKQPDARFYTQDDKFVNKYAKIFVDHPSCVGMDLNSSEDSHTIYDRILYDRILEKTIPYGVVPWGFGFSDAHMDGQFDKGWTVHWMPEKTEPELRTSMEKGTFFAISRYGKYPQEVGETPLDGKENPVPAVNRVTVNQEQGSISIEGSEYKRIAWVSKGEVISEEPTLVLSEHDAQIGSFVRAFLVGDGGICYVQPFTVLRDGQTLEKVEIPETHDMAYYMRGFVDGYNKLIPKDSPWRMLWNLIAHYDSAVDMDFSK